MTETDIQPHAAALLALAETLRHFESVLCQTSGENFNLFDILGIGHYEVRTHSPMLAELLNPHGSHGQGAVFLKKFLDGLEISDFDVGSARVTTEVNAGALGRLDIVLRDNKKRAIFIENKIHAGLQDKQLTRYHEYNTEATLLFLTLNGDGPSDWATNAAYQEESFQKVFTAISYRSDIIRWLEACRKEAATAHSVREVITQYIQLIKHLTNQSTSKRMNQEIINHITQDPTGKRYLAYASLRNADRDIRRSVIEKVNEQMDVLGKGLGLETVDRFLGEGQKPEQYFYTTPTMRSMNLKFGIRCSPGYTAFVFGFAYLDGKVTELPNSPVIASFREIFLLDRTQLNSFWHVYEYWPHPHGNWDDTILAEIIKNNGLPAIGDLVSKLNRVAYEAAESLSK